MNAETTENRKRRSSSCVQTDEPSQNSSIPTAEASVSPPKKSKHAGKANPVPRVRVLKAEEERTQQVLEEKFRSTQNGMVCQVTDCRTKPIKCVKPSNLKRHLRNVHPSVYAKLFPNEVNKNKQTELEAFNAAQDAVELVTVNGYPFRMLSASGMHGFVKPRVLSARAGGHNLSINRHVIASQVAAESGLIKKYISDELKGNIISIMFDVCTNATLSMVGVNAAFMKESVVVCRSLGIIKITKRHTSVNLAELLFEILAEFGLTSFDVFTMTTDTARNAVATSRVLNSIASEKAIDSDDIYADPDENEDDDDEQDECDYDDDEIENQEEMQKVIENMAAHNELVTGMVINAARKNTSIQLINHVNCGTHVHQLAVNDALTKSNSHSTIKKVHDICVQMRNQIVMIELRNLGCKVIIPPLENETRWHGKFRMVSCYNKVSFHF